MAPASSSSSSSAAYAHRPPGGSFKFKGGEALSGTGKKKHKKSRSSTSRAVQKDRSKERNGASDDEEGNGVEAERSSRAAESSRGMTAAEQKFQEARRKRMAQRVDQKASLSHKDRVDQFNKALADRSEHNDMLTVAGH